jgi:hypothetical protein
MAYRFRSEYREKEEVSGYSHIGGKRECFLLGER